MSLKNTLVNLDYFHISQGGNRSIVIVEASHVTINSVFVQQLVEAKTKGNINAPPVDCPHKGPVMRKARVDAMPLLLSGVPDYFDRNKISSGGDLSHYSSASLY